MDNHPGGWRCHQVGDKRYAVKMPPHWRGRPGRDGRAARDVAEFCSVCWGTGLFPHVLLEPQQPQAQATSPTPGPLATTSPLATAVKSMATNTSTMSPTAAPATTTSTLQQRALNMVREFMFETTKEDTKKVVASCVRGAPSYRIKGVALRKEAHDFRARYPMAPKIAFPPPVGRALQQRANGVWTQEALTKACDIFMLDFDIMCIMPELTHFDELSGDDRWCVPGFADRVCMPCAQCGTNKFVSLSRPSVLKGSLKFFHGFDGPIALVYSRYCCANPACPSVKRDSEGRIIPKEFSAHTKTQLDMLPSSVRLDFDFELLPSGRGGYTHTLRSFLLNSCAKQLQDVHTIAEQVSYLPTLDQYRKSTLFW